MDTSKPENRYSLLRRYSYSGSRRVGIFLTNCFGLLEMLIFTGLGVLLIIEGIIHISSGEKSGLLNDPRISALCFSILSVFAGWFIVGMLINNLPTIWLGEEGITISHFIVFRIFIPWTEIIDVVDRRQWFYNYTLVLAKRITLFHRLYGWFYMHMSHPCFRIGEDIDNKKELVSMIRSKAFFYNAYYQR